MTAFAPDPRCDPMCGKPWGRHNVRCASYRPPLEHRSTGPYRPPPPIPRCPADVAIDLIRDTLADHSITHKEFARRLTMSSGRLSSILVFSKEPSVAKLRQMWAEAMLIEGRETAPPCPADLALNAIQHRLGQRHIALARFADQVGVSHKYLSDVLMRVNDPSLAVLRKMWIEAMR